MHRPDSGRMASSGHLRGGWLLLLALAAFLLAGGPALGQTGYTGVTPPPPPPPGDTYVDPVQAYPALGASPGGLARLPAPAPAGSPGTAMSVGTENLNESAQPLDQGRGRLVTGWDLVIVAALGLTALVAFATTAGRFRSF